MQFRQKPLLSFHQNYFKICTFYSKLSFVPFLISVCLFSRNTRLGTDFGHPAETVTIGYTIYYLLFTSSSHPSLRDLGKTNCTKLFHHVREPPPLKHNMTTREQFYLLCSRQVWGRKTESRSQLGANHNQLKVNKSKENKKNRKEMGEELSDLSQNDRQKTS